jgi:S1-C subfamily serine protease
MPADVSTRSSEMDEQQAPPPALTPTAWVGPNRAPAADPHARRGRRARLIAAGCALAALGCASGIAIATASSEGRTITGHGSITADGATSDGTVLPRYGYPGGGFGNGPEDGSAGPGQAGTVPTGTATAAQQIGVVDIATVLNYGEGSAAGTGTVLTSDGEVLTNNHVIDDATKITVTVVSTGRSYSATVVGTDPSDDVAVLRLNGASGLKTANYGKSGSVAVGDTVTGVGNAGGIGGAPSAATGTVTALDQQITASDEDGSDPETLTGLIETNAAIEAGDSGGPLYDASGRIVGMDTAAQTDGVRTAAAYAITIDHALQVATQIESAAASNVSTSTIHIGFPAFLGIAAADTGGSGAGVAQVITGAPAAAAGLAPGDVITAVGGVEITNPEELSAALATHRAGDRVEISWTDGVQSAHTAKVTLASGPAD